MSAIEALSQEQKLLMFSNWQFVKIDEAILSQTEGLISKYSLKSHVAIHVISAVNRKIELIISSD